MTTPITFVRVDTARLLLRVYRVPEKDRGKWITDLAEALAEGVLGVNSYADELMLEAQKFAETVSERQRQKALIRWGKAETPDAPASRSNPPASRSNAGDAYKQASKQASKHKETLPYPPGWEGVDFQDAWRAWEKARKLKAGEPQLKKLIALSGGDLRTALAILQHSTDNQYRGIFPLTGDNSGKGFSKRDDRLNQDARDFLRDYGGDPGSPGADREDVPPHGRLGPSGRPRA